MEIDPQLAPEAKAIVSFAFRNGPIENLHAGRPCPTCSADPRYSRISDDEMKELMKFAVDHVYHLLVLRERAPTRYERGIDDYLRTVGSDTARWDEPEPLPPPWT